MFNVIGKLLVGDIYCVSVEGDTLLLKNGLELIDEKGNIFVIKTVGMPHYQNVEEHRIHAELVLMGDVENLGKTLLVAK